MLGYAVPASRPRDRDLEASAGHLLRLCLDLQLDALLLTLGALAADRAQDTAPATPHAPAVAASAPWHRWIGEDVDLACRLAAEALAGNASLPPSLGSDLGRAVPLTIIDDLVARYSSMLGLLQDLSNGHPGSQPDGLDEAIARTEMRLAELREHRLLVTPPTGIDLRSAHQFLPGELLG
jgi:hypothetical protein